MVGLEEIGGEELSLVHPDPVVLELNKLQNQLKVIVRLALMAEEGITGPFRLSLFGAYLEKDRQLGEAQSEIKALRATEVLKDKAIEELEGEVQRLDEKLRVTENLLEQKNLDIKKLSNEKREALAAQYAAEATLRRVYANQKDNDSFPIESIIAPLEADIKMYKNEIAALLEDKKALQRLTKSKEAALLEAERILKSALERALVVEEIQNQNFELKRQIEICQEENKILEKTNRQKVLEVEKLSQTIKELEEAILAGGAAANTIRDYRRQISQLNEEKRMLERELARITVSANRVASVVANEWKDENDKVMPVKQWLEERRLLQAEMQRIREKLTISEKTAKAEAQLKDKLKLRLKILEEGLKQASILSLNSLIFSGSPKSGKSNHFFGILSSNSGLKKRSTSQPRPSTIRSSEKPNVKKTNSDAAGAMKRPNNPKKVYASESLLRKSLWTNRSKVVDRGEKENTEIKENTTLNVVMSYNNEILESGKIKNKHGDNEEARDIARDGIGSDDMVSGFLYDRLQKEVISLRKFCEAKDDTLTAKDEEIKTLMKKVETLTKAMEVEYKKLKREAVIRERDPISTKVDDKIRNSNSTKRAVKAS